MFVVIFHVEKKRPSHVPSQHASQQHISNVILPCHRRSSRQPFHINCPKTTSDCVSMDPIDDLTRLQMKCERVEKERDKFRDALWALREEFTALQMRSEKIEGENAELKEALSFGLSRRKSPDIVQPPPTAGDANPVIPALEKVVHTTPVLQPHNSKPASLLGKRTAMKLINNNSEPETQPSPSKRVRFAEKETINVIHIANPSPPSDHEVDVEVAMLQLEPTDQAKFIPEQGPPTRIKTQWDPLIGKRVPISKQPISCKATVASDNSTESECQSTEGL